MNPTNIVRKVFPTARRLLVERSIKSLSIPKYDNVLIAGAGHDPYAVLFSNAKKYIRLDITPIKGKTDIIADAMALPFKDASLDCVLASELIEHLKYPFLFVDEVERVLKLGGCVIITIPFMFQQHADPFDYYRFTPEALKVVFQRFNHVEIMVQGNRSHVISDLLTTAFRPYPILFPLRIFNHLLVWVWSVSPKRVSTAPSGFILIGRK